MAPVDSNQVGTGKWILCNMVEIIPTITFLCGLLALCIGARGLGSCENPPLKQFLIHHGLLAR